VNSTVEDRLANLEQFKMITELNLPNLDDRLRSLRSVVFHQIFFIIYRAIFTNLRSKDLLKKL
jgi:hypothetical protein